MAVALGMGGIVGGGRRISAQDVCLEFCIGEFLPRLEDTGFLH